MSAQPPMERVSDGSENAPMSQPAPAPPAPMAAPMSEPAMDVSGIIANIRAEAQNQPPPVTPVAAAPATAPAPAPVVEPVATPQPVAAPVAAPEPVPTVEPEPVIAAPESRLAPIFELGDTDDAARSAADIVRKLRYDDPVAAENLLNGVFYAEEKTIQAWTLQRLGIAPEKVAEFKEWVESGQALPTVNALPPFPVPDANGVVNIDGAMLDLSVDPATGLPRYPSDKLAYENAKKLYAFDQKEELRVNQERQTKETERKDAEKREMAFHDECFDGTAKTFLDERMGVVKSLLEPAIANLAPEDKLFGEMFEAFVELKVMGSEEMFKVGKQAQQHLVAVIGDTVARCQRAGYNPAQIKEACNARLKEGRMVDFAASEDKFLRLQINKYKTEFVNLIARRNRAEIAATATAPVIPEGVQPIAVSTPPLDNGQPAQNLEDILAQARAQDRATAAQYRQ